jgi:hypothetical protein
LTVVDNDSTSFTSTELARLETYRAAVAAGFYSDWDGSAMTTDTKALAWLTQPRGTSETYPFTPDELIRLEQARSAVAAGYYREDGVSGSEAAGGPAAAN